MRRLAMGAVAVMMVLAGSVEAQGRWSGSDPFEVEWSIIDRQGSQPFEYYVTAEVRFRNLSGYTTQGFWSLNGISMLRRADLDVGCDGSCGLIYFGTSTLGNVQTTNVVEAGRHTLAYSDAEMFYSEQSSDGGQYLAFGPFAGPLLPDQHAGVLGCAVPRNPLLNNPSATFAYAAYGGRTCAREGFDGWLRATVTYWVPDEFWRDNFSHNELVVVPEGEFVYAPVRVVPEPVLTALFLPGALLLLACRRKRITMR